MSAPNQHRAAELLDAAHHTVSVENSPRSSRMRVIHHFVQTFTSMQARLARALAHAVL
jgi:hypothetical protein